MDTTNTTQTPPVQNTQPSPAAQPDQPAQPAQQMPPVAPVSGGHKEHAPIGRVSEYVQRHHTETTPDLPSEVKEAGVDAVITPVQPHIPQELKELGITESGDAVPVPVEPSGQVSLPTPMSYQQAVTNVKTHKTDDSVRWLAMLSKYVLEKLGMQNTT
jgi:hypothetical protein